MTEETTQNIQPYTDNILLAVARAAAIGLLFLFGFILIIASGAFLNPRNRLASRLKQQWMAISLHVLGIKVQTYGHIPNTSCKKKPTLWVSNHVSWTDINVLNSLGQITFLSKAEVKKWPIVGKLASASGTLFVERGSGNIAKVTEQITNVLQTSQSVVVFPEATTTDGTSVRHFFHPIFAAAIPHRHAITPITIVYERQGQRCTLSPYYGDDHFGRHLWRLLHLKGITAHVTFHPPLVPTTDDAPKILAKSAEQIIRGGLQPF